MNYLVVIFFLHNVVATLLLGSKFIGRRDLVFKKFGAGLILNSIAFAIWSIAVITVPQNLEFYITIGTVFFIASLVFYLDAGNSGLKQSKRNLLLLMGTIAAFFIFILRTFVYPSNPGFSSEGLFFFNPQPIVQLIYIFGLTLTALPAIDALADKFGHSAYSYLVRYGFIAEVMGGLMLIISADTIVLYITGLITGIVYLTLWTSLLFSKKAWESIS